MSWYHGVFKHIASLASPARSFSGAPGPLASWTPALPTLRSARRSWMPSTLDAPPVLMLLHQKSGINSPVEGKVVYVVYPIIYGCFKYIPGGCWGFLPATVSLVLVCWLVRVCPVYHDVVCLLLFLGDSFLCVCVDHMCIEATFSILVSLLLDTPATHSECWITGCSSNNKITLNQTRSVMLPPAPLLDWICVCV